MVEHLQSPEVIAYPEYGKPFIVHCDASESGLGAVLYQRQEDVLRVVSFASCTLTNFTDSINYRIIWTIYTDSHCITKSQL